MRRAALLLWGIGLAGCAKEPRPLVELRAGTDPLALYCRSGHLIPSPNRTLDVVGCTGATYVEATPVAPVIADP